MKKPTKRTTTDYSQPFKIKHPAILVKRHGSELVRIKKRDGTYYIYVPGPNPGDFYAVLTAKNGRTVWETSEGYKHRADVNKAIDFLKGVSPLAAEVYDLSK